MHIQGIRLLEGFLTHSIHEWALSIMSVYMKPEGTRLFDRFLTYITCTQTLPSMSAQMQLQVT